MDTFYLGSIDINKAFYDACERGDLHTAKYLIDNGADVNVRVMGDIWLETPLQRAIYYSNIEFIKLLIDNGADVNVVDGLGKTPLHTIYMHFSDGVKYLVENGADVNARDCDGETPLHRACKRGLLDVIKIMVENGADVENVSHCRERPLYLVCLSYYERLDIVQYLVENGARYKINMIEAACYRNHINIVKYFIKLGARDAILDSPLRSACCNGSLELIKCLVENGALINTRDINGYTPLHFACDRPKNLDIVKYLVENGANTEARNKFHKRPLEVADNKRYVDTVKYLMNVPTSR